jgi:D-beta-D-heptose 7-phosphate kinase/D-beta-D-heptose 1-phosphate adenosyltransferase
VRGPRVVIGDALLDVDLEGRAERLMPEAPAPVIDDLVERPRPGGAALAAAMASDAGHEVVLVTALGRDEAGERVAHLLRRVDIRRLPYDGPTPVKQRVRAAGRSLLRLDRGNGPGRLDGVPAGLVEVVHGAGAVLVADYGRGVTGIPALREMLADLPPRVPVVWDPHLRGTQPVPGVRLATPNATEAARLAARAEEPGTAGGGALASARRWADFLVSQWQARSVAVTLGDQGALLSYGDGVPVVTPAPQVQCVDPCGAGDRFAVTAALSLGAGLVTTEAVQEAVAAASAYVAAGGPASLSQGTPSHQDAGGSSVEELVRQVSAQGGTVVATGGCFDLLHAGHVATLRAARRLGDCLVVCLNSDDSVRRLKGGSRPLVPAADRVRVLEALECVDAVVVFDEDTPSEVLRRVRPDVWAKGGDYAGTDVPEAAALEEWGGQAVVLPYLQGRSTSRLVETAAQRSAPTTNLDPDKETL